MGFYFDISPLVAILIAATLVFAIMGATIGLKQMRTVARTGHRFPTDEPDTGELPGVSVIVYAHNAEEHIREFITALLAQDHPNYDVIVVNDASDDNTAEIVNNMLAENDRLYMTFVSPTARNISHRKMAYTMGLRAAKHPIALLTASNVNIPGPSWLRHMSAPFADNSIDVGIGAAYVPSDTDKGKGRYWRSFDSIVSLSRWLGASLENRTYRGIYYNLAFRKSAFFNHNGFAGTNRFQGGDDDIFINEISTPANTATIFRPEAMPSINVVAEEYPRLWLRNKERYTFTSHYLHSPIPRMQGLLSACVWGTLLCTASVMAISFPNLLPGGVALIIMLSFWGYQICVYRRAAKALFSLRLWWSVPVFWLARPIANALYNIGFQANRHTNYTWQQPK